MMMVVMLHRLGLGRIVVGPGRAVILRLRRPLAAVLLRPLTAVLLLRPGRAVVLIALLGGTRAGMLLHLRRMRCGTGAAVLLYLSGTHAAVLLHLRGMYLCRIYATDILIVVSVRHYISAPLELFIVCLL